MFDAIRRAFADTNQVSPALFSFNAQGSCPKCKGRGFLEVELSFLDDVRLDCKVCEGRRYRDDVLKLTYHGRSIHDVLEMTVADALGFFASVEDPRKRTWASATCASASRCRPSRAAKRSASSWLPGNPASTRAVRSPAGAGWPASFARKHAAATAIEALGRGTSGVVQLGEVGGQGHIVERPAVEPGIEPPERAGVGPPRVRADGGLDQAARGCRRPPERGSSGSGLASTSFMLTVIIGNHYSRHFRPGSGCWGISQERAQDQIDVALTGLCRDCHDNGHDFILFLSAGGSPETFRTLWSETVATLLLHPEAVRRSLSARGTGRAVRGPVGSARHRRCEATHRRGVPPLHALEVRMAGRRRDRRDRSPRRPAGMLARAQAVPRAPATTCGRCASIAVMRGAAGRRPAMRQAAGTRH